MRRGLKVRGVGKHWRAACDAPGSPVWKDVALNFYRETAEASDEDNVYNPMPNIRWLVQEAAAMEALSIVAWVERRTACSCTAQSLCDAQRCTARVWHGPTVAS